MAGQAVGRLFGQVAIEEPVAGPQAVGDGPGGRDHLRVVGGHHPPERQGEDARVQAAAPEVLAE